MKKQTGKILLAGGRGLVGTILKKHLERHNKTVYVLSRSDSSGPHVVNWDPDSNSIDQDIGKHRYDVLINLCGAGIADQRWTTARKETLYDSRLIPTRFLWSLIRERRLNADKFIQISASGFYGDRPGPVNEDDQSGSADNFLVRLTKDWEDSFLEDALDHVPHCRIRLGVVISALGGFMDQFLTPVRFFISPYFGDGTNYISWIHEDDLAEMIYLLTEKENLDPVYNISTPHPITSKQFSKKLSQVFNPSAISFPVPAWILEPLFGEMKTAILADVQMIPAVFQNLDYHFQTPVMGDALEKVKKRKR